MSSEEEEAPPDDLSSSSLSLHTIPDDENNALTDFFDYTDPKYLTRLNVACRANDVQMVKEIIEAGEELNGIDNMGNTAVHYAAKHGSLEVLQLLISQNRVRTNTQNHWGDYPLHSVAKYSMSYEVAKALLRAGCEVDCKNNSLNTPLSDALTNTRGEPSAKDRLIRLLLKNNAELNYTYNISYESPFYLLVKASSRASNEEELEEFMKLIALCLRHDGEVNNFNREDTAFMYAVKFCSSSIIELLRPYALDFDETTCTFNSTVFMKALRKRKSCVFDMIRDGADINLCGDDISCLSLSLQWEEPTLFNYIWQHCDLDYVLGQHKFFLTKFLRNCSFSRDNFLKAFYLIYDSEHIETLTKNNFPDFFSFLKHKIIKLNVPPDEAEKLVYTSLIYNNVVRFKDLRGFYKCFGFDNIFEAFLKVNVHIIQFGYFKDCMVARICYPHLDKTVNWSNCCGEPKSLLELCRNVIRANLQPKPKPTSNLYFEYYNRVQRCKLPATIKDIICLKYPIGWH